VVWAEVKVNRSCLAHLRGHVVGSSRAPPDRQRHRVGRSRGTRFTWFGDASDVVSRPLDRVHTSISAQVYGNRPQQPTAVVAMANDLCSMGLSSVYALWFCGHAVHQEWRQLAKSANRVLLHAFVQYTIMEGGCYLFFNRGRHGLIHGVALSGHPRPPLAATQRQARPGKHGATGESDTADFALDRRAKLRPDIGRPCTSRIPRHPGYLCLVIASGCTTSAQQLIEWLLAGRQAAGGHRAQSNPALSVSPVPNPHPNQPSHLLAQRPRQA